MRAQYLRIQALHLEQAGLLQASMELLDEVVREYAQTIELASAHQQLASCHERAGSVTAAVRELRRAIAAERKRPNVRVRAWLEFGRLVAQHNLTDLCDEFLNLVDERERGPGGLAAEVVFPADRYLFNAGLALVFQRQGDLGRARQHAKAALTAADAKDSGFRYHPELGLVEDTGTDLFRRISAIAADG